MGESPKRAGADAGPACLGSRAAAVWPRPALDVWGRAVRARKCGGRTGNRKPEAAGVDDGDNDGGSGCDVAAGGGRRTRADVHGLHAGGGAELVRSCATNTRQLYVPSCMWMRMRTRRADRFW